MSLRTIGIQGVQAGFAEPLRGDFAITGSTPGGFALANDINRVVAAARGGELSAKANPGNMFGEGSYFSSIGAENPVLRNAACTITGAPVQGLGDAQNLVIDGGAPIVAKGTNPEFDRLIAQANQAAPDREGSGISHVAALAARRSTETSRGR